MSACINGLCRAVTTVSLLLLSFSSLYVSSACSNGNCQVSKNWVLDSLCLLLRLSKIGSKSLGIFALFVFGFLSQMLDSCSSATDCLPGLFCGNCPALGTTKPICTRGQATIPTSIVRFASLLSIIAFLFGLYQKFWALKMGFRWRY